MGKTVQLTGEVAAELMAGMPPPKFEVVPYAERCRRVLVDGTGVVDEIDPQRCGEPAPYRARDRRALYSALCIEHWCELECAERLRYRHEAEDEL